MAWHPATNYEAGDGWTEDDQLVVSCLEAGFAYNEEDPWASRWCFEALAIWAKLPLDRLH